jgi:hypothetical protein
MAGGRENDLIDSRLLENALWLLRRYALRVTAAREAGHNTHGDGTALDLVPASPVDQLAWDASAGALSRDLGWTRACAASGVRPVCGLVPAISSSAMRATPATDHRAPVTAAAPRTCTSHGCHRATAPACRPNHALGSVPVPYAQP